MLAPEPTDRHTSAWARLYARPQLRYATVAALLVADVLVLRVMANKHPDWLMIGLAQAAVLAITALLAAQPARAARVDVHRLTTTLDAVIAGDLETDFALESGAGSLTAALSERVGTVISYLRNTVAAAREVSTAIDDGWREIIEVCDTMSTTSESTAAQASAAAAAVEQMSSSVRIMAEGIDQIAMTIREIAVHAADASRTAQQATEDAGAARTTVAELGEACHRVEEVVRFINNVAGQTHMLALNATIEAARAGAAGRGFAVVADEVKQLAEETSKATGNADRSVSEIQAESATAASAMATIAETIRKVSDNQAAIAAAVEEQTATTNDIGRGASDVAAGSQEIARNVAALVDIARVTAYGGAQGRTTAAELARVAALLEEQIGRFRVPSLTRVEEEGAQISEPIVRPDGTTVIQNSVFGVGKLRLDYQGRWCHSTGNVETDGTNSYSSMPDDVVVLRFAGSQLRFYGVKDANHGIAAISIDGGPETDMDEYSAHRAAEALLYTSPRLGPGEHTATVRVTGRKHPDSRYVWVTVDRIEVAR